MSFNHRGITIGIVALAATANAQWTATELDGFAARGIDGSAMVGETPAFTAQLWTAPNNVVDLHPAGALRSYAYDLFGSQQAGEVVWPGGGRAALWSGTASSLVDLHPAGAMRSVANAVSGSWQAGFAVFGGIQRAATWQGTAASWIDFHPVGATLSFIEDLGANSMVGAAKFDGTLEAGIWSPSFISLHPDGASESVAYGVYENRQVGFATIGTKHAALWNSTPESFIDLNPTGSTTSVAYGLNGATQVGFATIEGIDRAAYWVSNHNSFVDLHPYVDPTYTESWAYDIWKHWQSGTTYVVGRASNGTDSTAALWTRGPDEIAPHTVFRRTGTIQFGNVGSVAESDDSRLIATPGVTLLSNQWPLELDFIAQAPNYPATHLTFFAETAGSTPIARVRIEIYNYALAAYEQLINQPSTTGDLLLRFDKSNANDYISASGQLKCRISYKASGPVLIYPWQGRIDWVRWRIMP